MGGESWLFYLPHRWKGLILDQLMGFPSFCIFYSCYFLIQVVINFIMRNGLKKWLFSLICVGFLFSKILIDHLRMNKRGMYFFPWLMSLGYWWLVLGWLLIGLIEGTFIFLSVSWFLIADRNILGYIPVGKILNKQYQIPVLCWVFFPNSHWPKN